MHAQHHHTYDEESNISTNPVPSRHREGGSGQSRIQNSFMASLLLFKADKMRQRLQGGLSCSSAASTSVVAFSSGRAIDRHSPHLQDPHRRLTAASVPKPNSCCSSSSSKLKHKSTAAPTAGSGRPSSSMSAEKTKKKKKKTAQLQQPMSPASSSRFLLNSSRLLQQSDEDDVAGMLDSLPPLPPPSFIPGAGGVTVAEQIAESSSSSPWTGAAANTNNDVDDKAVITRSCSTSRSQHQVVVLRVSLHCKGCAGKVKKHISKMEGVTSLDIDIATKKVTVTGDVTPLGVLNCISKVKSAHFWPATSSSPPRASASF